MTKEVFQLRELEKLDELENQTELDRAALTKEQIEKVISALTDGVKTLNHHNLPRECMPLHEAIKIMKGVRG